ncbi:MAG: dihydroneopterin aldolase [Candidatus Pacebacteria bacterium]|nr:dihydroneopterin aldolase [Candidatus Paceibacterota bacterium]
MIGKIFVSDLKLSVKVGHLIHERQIEQPIVINIAVWGDVGASVTSENLSDTIDYVNIKNDVMKLVSEKEFVLIETLANDILDLCLKEKHATKAWIKLEKPHKFPECASVGIEMEKTR